MREINIAFIGTGIIAHQHARLYAEIPGVNVIAACDIDATKLGVFCDQYKISHRYTDYRALLQRDDIVAVDVNLHNNLHKPMSIAVMAAGKHCYCEKPMAGSYIDALAMQQAAAQYGKKLHIQLARIYDPATACAKTLMERGRLGEVYHARSYGYRRRGRPFVDGYAEKEFVNSQTAGHGALYDMGVYHISRLLYLLETPKVERISGNVYQQVPMNEARRIESAYDVEELGVGLVKFEGGLTMDILESWAINGGEFPQSSVHGSLGGIQFANERELKFFTEIEDYPANCTLDVAAEQYRKRKVDPDLWMYGNSQAHWIGILRGEVTPINTAEIALQTMLISEGIFLSGLLNREVTADEIPELCSSNATTRQETAVGVFEYV
ncbi:MAG: Gfo/Idh/MocA family oxidoreductase [Defluviitaleaceae bacterium]|nr:Gfo/Idh/MocA family oxidoreductase [Defluviitaleaceae bacterium]